MARRRRRRQLGLTVAEHNQTALDWKKSADNILRVARQTKDRCRAIEHYTDAVGELSVAAMQAEQGGQKKLSEEL